MCPKTRRLWRIFIRSSIKFRNWGSQKSFCQTKPYQLRRISGKSDELAWLTTRAEGCGGGAVLSLVREIHCSFVFRISLLVDSFQAFDRGISINYEIMAAAFSVRFPFALCSGGWHFKKCIFYVVHAVRRRNSLWFLSIFVFWFFLIFYRRENVYNYLEIDKKKTLRLYTHEDKSLFLSMHLTKVGRCVFSSYFSQR